MKDKLINEFAKQYGISSQGLQDVYNEYVKDERINKEAALKLSNTYKGFGDNSLENLKTRRDIRLAIEEFLPLLYAEFNYVDKEEVVKPGKTEQELVKEKEQRAKNLRKMEAMEERKDISNSNWKQFKLDNPKTREFSKEEIEELLKTGQYQKHEVTFADKESLEDNLFYHGTKSNQNLKEQGLKPSIILNNKSSELGGGYGEKYYGISLSESKAIAAGFSKIQDGKKVGIVYSVLLSPNAKVLELPALEDSVEIEDNIEEYWAHGVDAIKLLDEGEREIVILNPGALLVIDREEISREDFLRGSIESSKSSNIDDYYSKTSIIGESLLKQNLNVKLKEFKEETRSLSNKQVNAKDSNIVSASKRLSHYESIKYKLEKLESELEYILDNLDNFVEEGTLSQEEADSLKEEYKALVDRVEGLKKGLNNDIRIEYAQRDYNSVKDSEMFRDLLKKEGLTMRHKDAQDLAKEIAKNPEPLRTPLIKALMVEKDIKESVMTVMEVVNNKSITKEEKAERTKEGFAKSFSMIDFQEKVIKDTYLMVDKAYQADFPSSSQRELLLAWSEPRGIKDNFKLLEGTSYEQKEKLKSGLHQLGKLEKRELGKQGKELVKEIQTTRELEL